MQAWAARLLGFRLDEAVVISGERFARCMGVDGIEADHVTLALEAAGVELRSDVLDFHSRKLAFLRGPEGITVELAQWDAA